MSSRPSKLAFAKPWLSCLDQVALLQSRGLVIRDPAAAAHFLSHVNYYRFSGYCLAFEQARHHFLPGVTFEQVRASYDFDRVLRDLVTEALELIVWAIKPNLPPGPAWSPPLLPGNGRLFVTLLMLYELLQRCPAVSPFDQEWRTRLHAHLASPPRALRSLERMGLTTGWNAHPVWK